MIDKFCSACGSEFGATEYPKSCEGCGSTAWGTPTPVVLLLQPVIIHGDYGPVGLAIARRAIEPFVGRWAFMGGHVNRFESLEDAAVREWQEETGLVLISDRLDYVQSFTTPANQILAAFECPTITRDEYSQARLCPENLEFGILRDHSQIDDLCFPIHRQLARQWLDG